jgi:thiol-disulfide isomerase/thioredoxin
MKKILPPILLLLLLSLGGYSQTPAGYVPDLSLTAAQFQEQVFQPKSEVWVIDFWASWCGPCMEAAPYMKETQQKYISKGVRFISLSWDEHADHWQFAMNRLKMPWQQLRITNDFKPFIDQHFPHKGVPAAFIVRSDGKVRRVQGVGMLESSIQKALRAQK